MEHSFDVSAVVVAAFCQSCRDCRRGAPRHYRSIEVVEREQKRMTLFRWKEENMTPDGDSDD
jgi:hypothetical protein